MHTHLLDLLSVRIMEQITQQFELVFDVALPGHTACMILRQDVKLDKMLVTGEEAKAFKQGCP